MSDSEKSPHSPDLNWPNMIDPLPPHPEVPHPHETSHWEWVNSFPVIDPTVWVAPGALVNGRVELKKNSSIWYGCILRGDGEYIEVGEDTNVQDSSILHVDPGYPCILGDRVTLGHRALVHASVVKDDAMIAIGATILSRCVIGEGAIVGAGALVLEGTEIPPRTLWAGCPARQIKELSEEHLKRMTHTWQHYVNKGTVYLKRYGREHIDQLLKP